MVVCFAQSQITEQDASVLGKCKSNKIIIFMFCDTSKSFLDLVVKYCHL
jgi:hypothetical protein